MNQFLHTSSVSFRHLKVRTTVLYSMMNTQYHVKILLKSFHLNVHKLEIYPQPLARSASGWEWKGI